MPTLSQTDFAQKMYSSRAAQYEQSWHPSYSARLMSSVVRAQRGERVLVLACGTGLESFIAARNVGSTGKVVGVDVTEAMLEQAQLRQQREKQEHESEGYAEMVFVKHDIANLDSCEALRGMEGGFDVIVCSCAFVLLDHSDAVVRAWKKWLYNPDQAGRDAGETERRARGRLVIDITHESNMVQGIIIEEVCRDMGIPFHSNRLWIKDQQSFSKILESEGYEVVQSTFMDKVASDPVSSYGADEADKQFDYVVGGTSTGFVWEGMDLARARELFRRKWKARAVNGSVDVVDGLYVYVASPK